MVRTGGGLAPSMGFPPAPNDRGPAINYKDCQVRFRLAWARIKPTLTSETIEAATRHAEGLLEQQAAKGAEPKAPEPLRCWRTVAQRPGTGY